MTTDRNSPQGKDSVAWGLAADRRPETSWRQTLLFPPDLVTCRLDMGWDRDYGLGMFAAEVFFAASRELIALEVHPVVKASTVHEFLTKAQAWQGKVWLDVMDPEPF